MKTRLFISLLGFSLIAVSSCKKAADPISNNCEQASKKANDIAAAAQAYASSQTRATCEAYKKALNDYITAVDRCTNIPQSQINQYRQDVNRLTCQ